MIEERRSSETVFQGKLLSVSVDQVQREDGREATREVVHHPGAVAILPVHADGSVTLVRQFRYAAGRHLLEVPAGTREPGEEPLVTAIRELQEETGIVAQQVDLLQRFYISPGWCDEQLYIYRARDLASSEATPEDDEAIDIVRVPADELQAHIDSGEIADAKTIVAVVLHLASLAGASNAH